MDYLDRLFDSATNGVVKLIDNKVQEATSTAAPTQVKTVDILVERDGKPANNNKNLMYAGVGIAAAVLLLFYFKKSK